MKGRLVLSSSLHWVLTVICGWGRTLSLHSLEIVRKEEWDNDGEGGRGSMASLSLGRGSTASSRRSFSGYFDPCIFFKLHGEERIMLSLHLLRFHKSLITEFFARLRKDLGRSEVVLQQGSNLCSSLRIHRGTGSLDDSSSCILNWVSLQ
jgi:hypothetical protein